MRGAFLAVEGLTGVVYGLIEWPNSRQSAGRLLSLIALGVAALVGFLVNEAKVPMPMLPLSLFRSRTFAGANLLTLLLYGGLAGALFFFPFNLIQVQGYTTTAAGAALLPFILIMFVLSRWSGGLVSRYGARLPLTVGPIVSGAGFALFAIPGIGGSYWTTFFPAVLMLSMGMSLSVAPLTTAVMNAVDPSHAGVASGINNTVSRVASLLAIAVLGILLVVRFNGSLDRLLQTAPVPIQAKLEIQRHRAELTAMRLPAYLDENTQAMVRRAIAKSFVSGFRLVMLVAAGLALTSALAAWLLIEGPVR